MDCQAHEVECNRLPHLPAQGLTYLHVHATLMLYNYSALMCIPTMHKNYADWCQIGGPLHVNTGYKAGAYKGL